MKHQDPTIGSSATGAARLLAAGVIVTAGVLTAAGAQSAAGSSSAAGTPSAAGAKGTGHHGPRFPVSIEDAEARAEERFVVMDADGNGEISREEFEAAPRPRHHRRWGGHHDQDRSPAQRAAKDKQLFIALDRNGDGLLSPEEFSSREMRAAGRAMRREQRFTDLDSDGNGVLTQDEMPDMAAMLRAMDTDGDGVVTSEEALQHHRPRGPIDS